MAATEFSCSGGRQGVCLFDCVLKHWRDFGKCFLLKASGMFVFTRGCPRPPMLCGSLPGKVSSVCFYVTKKKKKKKGERKGKERKE